MIVSDLYLLVERLKGFLAAEHVEVLGVASRWEEAVDLATTLHPAVALVDMSMPLSVQGVRTLVRKAPAVKVVALALPDGRVPVLGCVEAGVCGFVRRDATGRDLMHVIRGATHGEFLCSPTEAGWLAERVADLSAVKPRSSPLAKLTRREVQVLGLLEQQQLTNKEIARLLSIAESTVKNHVHSLLKKTGVPNRDKAALRFREIGVRTLECSDSTTHDAKRLAQILDAR